MDCSTIIVSYNTFEMTREAVATALKSADAIEHEVIVVDNNSPDGSAERLATAFPADVYPSVRIIVNSDNPGFSAANNQGAEASSGRVLFFLNPDTLVHDDAIPRLVELLDDRIEVGAAGPRVLNSDGSDQPSTFEFPSAQSLVRHHLPVTALLTGKDQRPDAIPTSSCEVDIVKGCALAMRRDTYHRVGGWDDSYFMYAEETELCFALREAGYVNWFLKEAVITHFGGASTMDRYADQQVVHQRSVIQYLKRRNRKDLLVINRLAGSVGFAARSLVFPILSLIRPARRSDYQLRGAAARRLTRWFVAEYR